MSDHNIVCSETNLPVSRMPTSTHNEPASRFESIDFNTSDWDRIRNSLNLVDWNAELDHLDTEQCLQSICDTLVVFCHSNSKLKTRKGRRISKFFKDRKTLMRKRCRPRKKIDLVTCTHNQKGKYELDIVNIEKQICESHRAEKKQKEIRAVTCIKSNSNSFFKYAKKHSHTISHIGPLLNELGELTNDVPEMCNLLLNQYNSVFSTPCREKDITNPEEFFNVEDSNDNDILSDIIINQSVICDAINEMSSSSASGPDGLPAILFKECRDELSIPLQILFAKSFSENHIAQCLKSAAIVPVYKGGGASIPSNYRPISLTSIMMKILERVIRKQIIAFMTKRCVFNPSQHGFREGKSCLSALLTVYDNIMLTLNSSSSIDMIYLDFAKAFDKVDHNILLHKVKAIGIQGKLGIWIKNFLSNRTQHVRLPGGKSHCSSVISGVPQGTVLGPVLFFILMSDISKDINCNIIAFANDTRLYSAINSPADCDSLQCDLSNVYKWAESNNMKFNSKKFQYINFTVSPQCNTSNVYVSADSNLIDPSHTVKDLGVLMSNDCMFDDHICQVTKKCSQLCGWILRTFENRSELLMLTLFKSIVLSRIDYASQLWSRIKRATSVH